jgi:hypothetical protein
MATPIRIPFGQRLPQQPRFGELQSAMQQTAQANQRLGASIGRAAETIGNEIEEWQRRRDSLALAKAKSNFGIFADEEADRLWHMPDLDKPDQTGRSGFERADENYANNLKIKRTQIGNMLNPGVRKQFDALAEIGTNEAASKFKLGMIDREKAVQQQRVIRQISDVASSGNPEALMEFMAEAKDWIPPEKHQVVLDAAKEEMILAVMPRSHESPQAVESLIAKSGLPEDRKAILQSHWGSQHRAWIAEINAENTRAAREKKEEIEAAGRTLYTDIVNWDATNHQAGKYHSIVELAEIYSAGGMTKEAYDTSVKLVRGDVPEETDFPVWMDFDKTMTEVEGGRLSRAKAEEKLMEVLPKLSKTDRKQALDRLNSRYDAAFANAKSSAQKAVDSILSRFDADVTKEASSMVGYWLDQVLRSAKEQGLKLDPDTATQYAIQQAGEMAADLDNQPFVAGGLRDKNGVLKIDATTPEGAKKIRQLQLEYLAHRRSGEPEPSPPIVSKPKTPKVSLGVTLAPPQATEKTPPAQASTEKGAPEQPKEGKSKYMIGQVITAPDGKYYEVVKFDKDGKPLFKRRQL